MLQATTIKMALGRKMWKRLATVFFFQLILAHWVKSYPRCEQLEQEIVELVSIGALSSARLLALASLSQAPKCKDDIITAYVETANAKLQDERYLSYVDGAFHPATSKRPVARLDRDDCFYGHDDLSRAAEEWDKCCSILPGPEEQTLDLFGLSLDDSNACTALNRCCELFVGSSSYLRLPALHEPALRVRVGSIDHFEVLELEQDSFLRPFDNAGVLWPSGYLMTQCVADPIRCAPELHRALLESSSSSSGRPEAIELGTGVGAPSIALALYLKKHFGPDNGKAVVVATDVAPHAMALATANAKANLARVAFSRINHTDISSLEAVKSKFTLGNRGFAVVMGSSLESLFGGTEDPQSRLWKILDVLLDPSNPNAIAVLTHTTTDPLQAPVDGSFRLLRQVSGSVFGMQSRAGSTSCFEISLFQRSPEATLKHEDL